MTWVAKSRAGCVSARLARLVRADQKIEAIKLYRQMSGVGLKEAKDAVEALARGEPVQITRQGGFEAFESPDGKLLYYTRLVETPGVWQVPVDGGDEIQVSTRGVSGHFAVTVGGLYLVDPLVKPRPMIDFFPFGSHDLSPVVEWPGSGLVLDTPEFHVSRDGRWFLYRHRDNDGSDIAMLTGIR